VGAVLAIGAFGTIPFFLSRVEMPEPPPVVQATVERPVVTALGGALVFRDPATQSREFMGYYHTIELTDEQEAIKKEVLGAMPAACCSGSSAYTCCCPCNLSKTIWGLSNYVIAERGADAKQLRAAVDAWMGFVNPNGFRGNACYQGGCDSSMSGGGCGAMQEDKLTV
jgi:hypothetical protein